MLAVGEFVFVHFVCVIVSPSTSVPNSTLALPLPAPFWPHPLTLIQQLWFHASCKGPLTMEVVTQPLVSMWPLLFWFEQFGTIMAEFFFFFFSSSVPLSFWTLKHGVHVNCGTRRMRVAVGVGREWWWWVRGGERVQ